MTDRDELLRTMAEVLRVAEPYITRVKNTAHKNSALFSGAQTIEGRIRKVLREYEDTYEEQE